MNKAPKPDRSEIIALMKERYKLLGTGKAKQWRELTTKIDKLQRKMDGKK